MEADAVALRAKLSCSGKGASWPDKTRKRLLALFSIPVFCLQCSANCLCISYNTCCCSCCLQCGARLCVQWPQGRRTVRVTSWGIVGVQLVMETSQLQLPTQTYATDSLHMETVISARCTCDMLISLGMHGSSGSGCVELHFTPPHVFACMAAKHSWQSCELWMQGMAVMPHAFVCAAWGGCFT